MRETDIFLAFLGLLLLIYGALGAINQKIAVGLRGIGSFNLLGKQAQIAGFIESVSGFVMIIAALVSWLNVNWFTRPQSLIIWCLALAIALATNIISAIVALRSGSAPLDRNLSTTETLLVLGFTGIGVVGIVVAGLFVFFLVSIYEGLAGQNISRIIFLITVGVGVFIIAAGSWRIMFYDPPLEKAKRKRKPKPEPEHET